ncbi:MAG TPA: TIGR00730 family Rossman fold protein [Micropepsaceae bacterium]|nr:TIGR00730 family Rossman fold protein [Micropepsaceae bacterium]
MAVNSVCVFCGSSAGDDPAFAEDAGLMGRLIGERKLAFIFGGGTIGLMGVASRAAMAAGSHVTGIIPEFLRHVEAPRLEVSEMIVVETMHQRKQKMVDLADAFLILPGGIGTLDEFAEVTSWAILERHDKPVILLNTLGYFDSLIAFMETMRARRFAGPALKSSFAIVHTPGEAMARLVSPDWRRPASP